MYYSIVVYIPCAVHFIPMTHLVTGSLCLLIAPTYFSHSLTHPPLWQPPVLWVSMSLFLLCLFVCLVFHISHINEIIWICLWIIIIFWIISLSIILPCLRRQIKRCCEGQCKTAYWLWFLLKLLWFQVSGLTFNSLIHFEGCFFVFCFFNVWETSPVCFFLM